jgi:hypothetical protein
MTGLARIAVITLAYSAAFTIGGYYWVRGAALHVRDRVAEALT